MVGMQRTPIFAKHDQATKWLLPADLQGVLIIHMPSNVEKKSIFLPFHKVVICGLYLPCNGVGLSRREQSLLSEHHLLCIKNDRDSLEYHLMRRRIHNIELDMQIAGAVLFDMRQGSPIVNINPLPQRNFLQSYALAHRLRSVGGFLRLPLNSVQGAPGYQDAPYCDGNQRPVQYNRRNELFAPARLFRLMFGTILFWSGAWPRKRDIGSCSPSRLLRLLGKALTAVLIGMGLICLFWDRLKDNEQQSDSEPCLHSGESVSQKDLTLFPLCNTVSGMANVLSKDKQVAVIGALAEGSSIRSIERITGVHRDTIMRLGVRVGQGCAGLLDAKMRDLSCRYLQFDEVWGFIGKKERHLRIDDDPQYGDVWTFCAIDAETKLVPTFKVGKRDLATAKAFVSDLHGRLANRVQISSDALRAYVDAIEQSFGADVDFGQIVKTYEHDYSQHPEYKYSAPTFVAVDKRAVTGSPDMDLVSTSYIERLNATTRLHMRRLTRLTLAFSKKLENFQAAVALHFAYYNLVKRHGTLRCTPAMAAGIERDFWSVRQLIEAI